MKKTISIFLLATALVISGVVFSVNQFSSNVVYIDTALVYEKFNLSKELNGELEKVFKSRKHILDSLYDDLKAQSQDLQTKKDRDMAELDEFKRQEEACLYKQRLFEDENRSALEKCNQKIWEQINRYTEAYGKEKDYDYILGANGQGNIMYGRNKKNVTDELVEYLNLQYEDKAK